MPLPTPESIVKAVFEIEGLLRADPTRAREALRTMLKDGIIELEPQADGTYIARGTVFPLMPLLLRPLEKPKPRDRAAEGLQAVYRSSCAGALCTLEHDASGGFKTGVILALRRGRQQAFRSLFSVSS